MPTSHLDLSRESGVNPWTIRDLGVEDWDWEIGIRDKTTENDKTAIVYISPDFWWSVWWFNGELGFLSITIRKKFTTKC